MATFQYIGEGHTLVQTSKKVKEKVKVVNGEMVEIEDGIFSEGRLVLAGFQKVMDGAEDIAEGISGVVSEAVEGAEKILDTITGDTSETEEGKTDEIPAENGANSSDEEKSEETPAEDTENAAEDVQTADTETPEVETEVVDDGKDEVTIQVAAKKKK